MEARCIKVVTQAPTEFGTPYTATWACLEGTFVSRDYATRPQSIPRVDDVREWPKWLVSEMLAD